MTVITQLDTATPQAPEAQIAQALSRVAADSAVLRLKMQAVRWHYAGPERRDLEDLLAEREGELTRLLNVAGARLRGLGFKVPSSMADYRTESGIAPDLRDARPAKEGPAPSLAELRDDLGRVIDSCRSAHALAAELDATTAGRLAAQIRTLEHGHRLLSALTAGA
jgi:starvation-inducible DNA-binding protein